MTLRRKLAVTTIAASVAMSAFAGIPLSSKGLSEKLGFSGVAYATSLSDLISNADKIYAELDNILGGVDAVEELQQEIAAALAADSSILAVLVEKLSDNQPALETEVGDLIADLLSNVLPDDAQTAFDGYTALYGGLVSDIRAAHGLSALTTEDIASVLLEMQLNFAELLVDFDFTPSNILAIREQLKEAADEAIASNTNVQDLATAAGITGEDLADVYIALQNSPQVSFGTLLEAYDKLNQAYKAAFPTSPPPTGGGGGGTPPPATTDVPAEVTALEEKFEALAEELANATDEEKAELIAAAIEEAQALIDDLSDLDSSVIVNGDTATLKLDENKALSAIKGIAAVVAALEEATGETLDSLDVTIDLGDVAQDKLVIGLSDAIMEEAVAAGLTGIILEVSGLMVNLPVGGTFSEVIDLKINKSEATDEVTGGLNAASKVYDFQLNVGGKETTSFSKPIQLAIPLEDTTGMDTELLTLAKIIEGMLEFHGGRYTGSSLVENRDTFSSYVVVENKLTFDDTESVDAWAGRAIEVIASKGVIHGVMEGEFDPASKVTRAQFAKMLVRALDLNNQAAKEKFADVKGDEWFAPYIAAAYENGLIYGRSATIFDPHAEISRAEMATMVTRGLKLTSGAEDVEDVEAALEAFADSAQINDTLKQGVAFAAENNIVIGNEGKFAPNDSATRAQAAVIIYRAYNFEA